MTTTNGVSSGTAYINSSSLTSTLTVSPSTSTSLGTTVQVTPAYNTYTIADGSLYYRPYGGYESVFVDEDISETTIRSIIVDMKKAGKTDRINYAYMLTNRNFSEKFLNDFYDNFDKTILYRTQQVSIDFIKKHLSDIEENQDACNAISRCQKLNEDFVDMFADHIDWEGFASNVNIRFSVSLLLKYIEKFSDNALKALCCNDAVSTGVFNKFLEVMPEDIRYKLDWEAISWHKELTEENILNNIDFIDFNSLLLCTRSFKDDVITCFRKVKFGI